MDKQDAGQNSPPAIVAVRSDIVELAEPGPVVFDVGPTAGTMSIELLDTDPTDTLYVRIFVDYNIPMAEPARSTCTAITTEGFQRTASCYLAGLCKDEFVNRVPDPYMTIVVFDREPLDDNTAPTYQAMPPGGLSTSRGYFLKCRAGAPT